MKKLLLLLPILILVILSCNNKEDPLSSEEKSQRGAISGFVTDTLGQPVVGANVATIPAGHTTATDSAGHFTIPDVEAGTYTLSFTCAQFKDTTSAPLQIAKAEDVVNISMNMVPDVNVFGIGGALTGDLSDIKKITATVSGDSMKTPVITELGWFTASKKYSGTFYTPKSGKQLAAEIKVYDSNGRVTGYKKMTFDKLMGTIEMPEFSAQNAFPQIEIKTNLADTVFFEGDTVKIDFAVTDSFGSPKEYYYQLKGSDSWIKCDSGKVTFVCLETADANYSLSVKAVDNEGNVNIYSENLCTNLWCKFTDVTINSEVIKDSDSTFAFIKLDNNFLPQLYKFDNRGTQRSSTEITGIGATSTIHFVHVSGEQFLLTGSKKSTPFSSFITSINQDGSTQWSSQIDSLDLSGNAMNGSLKGLVFNECLYLLGYNQSRQLTLFKHNLHTSELISSKILTGDFPNINQSTITGLADGMIVFASSNNLVRIDTNGVVLNKTLLTQLSSIQNEVYTIATYQNSLLISGVGISSNCQGFLSMLDADLNVIWHKNIVSSFASRGICSMEIVSNGVLCVGLSDKDMLLSKYDFGGNLQFQREISSKGDVYGILNSNIVPYSDGSCLLLSEQQYGNRPHDLRILKTDPDGNTVPLK